MLPSYHYEPYPTGDEPFTLPMLTPPDYLFDFCIVQDQWCSGFTFTSVAADPLRSDQNGRYLADDILKCIVFEQMLMLIVEYRRFLFPRVWLTNIGTIVRGQFPSLRVIYQVWLNIGRMVTAFRSGSGTCICSQGAYIWHTSSLERAEYIF